MERKIKIKFSRSLIVQAAFFGLLLLSAAGRTQAANLKLSPGNGNFLVGGTFDLSVMLDTKNVPANVVEAELLFPADKLQLANPSVGKSIIEIWTAAPVFSNQEGRIHFIGAIPAPGINTSEGVVLTLTFRVVAAGAAQISFGQNTRVLANDGKGTGILNQKTAAFFSLAYPPSLGPAVTSPTHPDPEKWYKDKNPLFLWQKNDAAQGYSYQIDRDPSGSPDTVEDSKINTVSFSDLESGVWYFHVRENANGVWGGATHFAVKIDDRPPAEFAINVSPGKTTAARDPVFRFFTTDALAGFDHFEMKIVALSSQQADEALYFEVSSPYQAVNLKPGRYQVVVRAFDRAQNTRDATATVNIIGAVSQFIRPEGVNLYFAFIPWWAIIVSVLAILLIIVILAFRLWAKHREINKTPNTRNSS